MVGLAQGALDAAIPYTLERKQFNQRIFDFQVNWLLLHLLIMNISYSTKYCYRYEAFTYVSV